MKQTKRRLLSLLMAFAILCTMIPAAFAAEEWTGGDTEKYPKCTHEDVIENNKASNLRGSRRKDLNVQDVRRDED